MHQYIRDRLTISNLFMPPVSMADSMKVDPWPHKHPPSYGPVERPVFFDHCRRPSRVPNIGLPGSFYNYAPLIEQAKSHFIRSLDA